MKKTAEKAFWLVAVLAGFLFFILAITNQGRQFFGFAQNEADGYKKASLTLDGARILADIADTRELMSKGLSGRRTLPAGRGMIFIFEEPGYTGFWMKDMNFPIDIIWFDASGKVVDWKADALPDSYPEVFTPQAKAKYVLEVRAGFVAEHGIKLGDLLNWD